MFRLYSDQKYFVATVHKTKRLNIDNNTWQLLMECREDEKKDAWKGILLELLKKVNPYCCLVFDNKWWKQRNSRKQSVILFRCRGHCKFNDCSIKFSAEISSEKYIVMTMTPQNVQHDVSERQARFISGSVRKQLALELAHSSPSTAYSQRFAHQSMCELQSGTRDTVGKSPEIFRKIKSESNISSVPHRDLVQSLTILAETFTLSKSYGFIQRISAKPFYVTMYTEAGVRIYHNQVSDSTLFCDATGTITSMSNNNQSRLLYYALVFGSSTNKSPVAVAEFISSEHSVFAVSHFLESFRYSEGLMYNFKNIRMPAHVVIDRSLVLLLSFLRVYNSETLSDFLHRCFRLVTQTSSDDADTKKVFIHACKSHCLKSAKADIVQML